MTTNKTNTPFPLFIYNNRFYYGINDESELNKDTPFLTYDSLYNIEKAFIKYKKGENNIIFVDSLYGQRLLEYFQEFGYKIIYLDNEYFINKKKIIINKRLGLIEPFI